MLQYLPPRSVWSATFLVLVVFTCAMRAQPQAEDAATDQQAAAPTADSQKSPTEVTRPGPPVDQKWKRLSPSALIWLDREKHTVIVGGEICHREGPLEMFACPRNTKEHESVVVVDCKAFMVHAALLATGIEPGKPVRFSPEYQPASGPVVDVFVEWLDGQGQKQRMRGQDWVKHMPTGKAMTQEWVFAGSGFWIDEETGERHYLAEGGELICVSNFSTATMDLPIKSSQETAALMFGAFAERIPPLGTKVHMILVPRKSAESTEVAPIAPKPQESQGAAKNP